MSESLRHRLKSASAAELNRLCIHLDIALDSSCGEVESAYLSAADNTIFNTVRPLLKTDAPTYSLALKLIYKEMRPFADGLNDTWSRVKALKFKDYQHPVDEMSDEELEQKILAIYVAEYADAKDKIKVDPSFWNRIRSSIPTIGTSAVGTASTVTAMTATRLPFAAVPAGSVAGPIGIALAVVLLGAQLSGPAYRKIIPATVELMLIGQRIKYFPGE